MRPLVRYGAVAVLGAGFGSAVSVLASHHGSDRPEEPSASVGRSLDTGPAHVPSMQYAPVPTEARAATPRGSASPSREVATDEPEPEPTPEEIEFERTARYEAAIDAHDRAPKDPAWARTAEAKLTDDLHEIAKGAFEIEKVDCRTSSCKAVLDWPSYGAAVNGFMDVMHLTNRLNCRREMHLAPPSNPTERYPGTAIFTNCLPETTQ